jgi:hypothetical protein
MKSEKRTKSLRAEEEEEKFYLHKLDFSFSIAIIWYKF